MPKATKHGFKYWAGRLHLWLGLALGAVALLSYLPAALYAWEPELTDWYYHDLVFVPEVGTRPRSATELLAAAKAAVPAGHVVSALELTPGAARAYIFQTYKDNPQPGWTYFSQHQYWEQIYVDPYTGRVLGMVDVTRNWIENLRVMHQQLLLRYDVGHFIIGTATLALLAAVLTGLVLWWPRNRAALRQRLTIKSDVRWRRRNYDLHNVGGFYAYAVILLLATSGLVWSFDWWEMGIYRLLGQTTKPGYGAHAAAPARPRTTATPLDAALRHLQTQRPTWTNIYVALPEAASKNPHELEGYVDYDGGTAWNESDTYFYHTATGTVTYAEPFVQKTTGEKWRNSNYPIHIGTIFGWPTRVLVCLATLVCASLPVTGFLIWWGRRHKARTASASSVVGRRRHPVAPQPV
ncbi:PepSY-associated TM helix domain-containing protein [Hymenobacter lapidiphilus]|uniref:PepSY domain-containing protein n=1 Tax=Hymenobacter lapidiphilus TaxID=2608003 RepID=A0A7Y7PQP9_9BACT|nr:PepSY-associated TM helix domain-containing protein [Hymenobacter lapidiphilus]NVO32290.1 PepSY domain-containing protein [Hymenobacter lapidiphilus]